MTGIVFDADRAREEIFLFLSWIVCGICVHILLRAYDNMSARVRACMRIFLQ